uniref:RING-type E3 ubiquitin transferase n=1 Tax=Panagrellus redivivus TaxID=6233 RepID=A0A7E4VAC0_PANRE
MTPTTTAQSTQTASQQAYSQSGWCVQHCERSTLSCCTILSHFRLNFAKSLSTSTYFWLYIQRLFGAILLSIVAVEGAKATTSTMAETQPSATKTTTEGSNRNPNRRRHNNQNNTGGAGGGSGQNQGSVAAGGGGSQRGGDPRQNNGPAGSHNHGNGAAGGGQRGGGGQNQNAGGNGGQRGGEGANPRQNNGGGGRRRGGNGEQGGGGRRGGGYQGGPGRRQGKQEPQVIKHRKDHAGIAFEGNVSDCHICCQPSDVFGVGQCLHPVCIECCIRMRILSDNKSCPQCRSPIETLYIVSAPTDWDTFNIPSNPLTNPDTNKYCLMFENAYTMRVYDSYLAHSCQICAKKGDSIEFPTFGALRHHTAQVHDRQFCTICCDHLNVLSKDRVTYSKDEYERHLRGADREASGHKGHPKCLFCELRFYDEEHQYRHMRQQYYFCQICEIDGGGNFFYPKIEQLRGHYRNKHHPCLEGECRDLGIVFRSDVELGVHRAAEHGSSKRNVNINFQFSNGHMGNRVPRNGGGREPRATGANSEPVAAAPAPPPPPPQPTVIIPSAQSPFVNLVPSRFNTRTNASDFPTLPTAPPTRPAIPTNWRQEVQAMRRPATQAGASRPAATLNSAEHFPSLGGGPRRPATASNTPDQFPSLGGGSSSSSSSKKPGNAANPWAKGQPAASLFAQPKVRLVKNNPEPSRKKVIPTPDIWPEGMRERVEAKMKGLPDPGPKEEVPLDPLFRVEAAKKAKRAAAKKKGVATASALTNDEEPNLVTKTKFNHLRDQVDSSDDESNKAGPSSSARPQLSRTADNFVRIDAAPTLRSVAASIGTKSTPTNTPKPEEPAKPKTSPKPKPDAPLPSDPTPAEAARLPAPSVDDLPSHPSLVELARMATSYWPFGRSTDGSETNSNVQKKPATAWSTGPPPGFN